MCYYLGPRSVVLNLFGVRAPFHKFLERDSIPNQVSQLYSTYLSGSPPDATVIR